MPQHLGNLPAQSLRQIVRFGSSQSMSEKCIRNFQRLRSFLRRCRATHDVWEEYRINGKANEHKGLETVNKSEQQFLQRKNLLFESYFLSDFLPTQLSPMATQSAPLMASQTAPPRPP